MVNTVREVFESLFDLYFPNLCGSCNRNLRKGESVLCTRCRLYLPLTDHFTVSDNPFERLFYGRAAIRSAAALFGFQKGGGIQRMVHLLKYGGRTDIGVFAGRMIGEQLLENARFRGIDRIVPVPLHADRLRTRGYNQAECIAEGIASVTGWPIDTTTLRREKASETQTAKGRYDRSVNVEHIFRVRQLAPAGVRHYLLVDDVVTTGATLVSCIQAIHASGSAEVSVASLAMALR